MKIFVTGAAGFVAEHLIPELQRLGHQVVGCDRKPEKKKFAMNIYNVT